MLYVIVVLDENNSDKSTEFVETISNLNLPMHAIPPTYFISFTGSEKELGHFLSLNKKEGPKGCVVGVSNFYLNTLKESDFAKWLNDHFPEIELIEDE